MPTCAIVSFRLGLTDGVSIVAAAWADALRSFGFDVVTVAGEGPVDRTVAGLAFDPDDRSDPVGPGAGATDRTDDRDAALARELEGVLRDADLVVVENLCTIPLNLPAARATAKVLAGRPAVLHHHDPPWQRDRFAHVTELPPTDPVWRHVTINRLTERQFAERGLAATTIYNGFGDELSVAAGHAGDREGTRARLGVGPDELLVAHPVRAIPRKDVPAAVRLCEQLGATYWLLGGAEEGYGPELDRVLAAARCRVIRRALPHGPDLYAAPDLVAFPSTWEGFGNPPVEAAFARKPVAVGPYPVGAELRALGFVWFDAGDPDPIRAWLDADPVTRAAMLDTNERVAGEHFTLDRMAAALRTLLDEAGWLP
jgi:glycosyltransferase involved in cell wall biosynthesis